ncbi:melanoma cell adhesion molecule b isoform X2 [Boleophthalmus pectinirostris]|uniref:melanoma cell adhesion molecule b isoform X2 n=1 Tax=Boleophthalmus pectinirostris TaxID=150288 RepID=UPI00242C004C|nr:melanoma cell adhesion molecule b isoform X2 [Boleophthalmus pectinirostris]
MEDRVDVRLGDTAQITCIFLTEDGPGGNIIQWFYVTRTGEKQRIYYLESGMSYPEKGTPFSDRISVNGTGATGEVVLTIDDVQLKDEVEFICIVKSLTDGTAEGRTKLRVFQAPAPPTIVGAQKGISINEDTLSKIGTCEVKNGYPKPNITWYKDKTPIRSSLEEVRVSPSITTESSGLYSVKSELSMKVIKEDADALFSCEITYFAPGGETLMVETSPINITVYYPHTALKMWVESPKGQIKEGDNVVIHCSGDGNNPYTSFSINSKQTLSSDSSELVLENVTRLNSGEYVCTALDMESFNEITENITVFVNYLEDVVIKPEKIIEVPQGEEGQATCNAMSSLPTQTSWFKNGEEVAKGHTLILNDATFDTAGTYVCVVTAQEVEGLERIGTLRVYIQGKPEILPPVSTEIEESMDTTVDLNCYVRGYPYPTVTWSTSEGESLPAAPETETDDGVLSTVSVKVTGDVIVFCNATSSLGEDSMAFNIKAIKPQTDNPSETLKKEGSGVIIAVIIICILLLAILGSVLYFLYKKGKICGRSGKQDLSKGKAGKDNIVVEMKSDNTEEAVLLGVNGEKQLQ